MRCGGFGLVLVLKTPQSYPWKLYPAPYGHKGLVLVERNVSNNRERRISTPYFARPLIEGWMIWPFYRHCSCVDENPCIAEQRQQCNALWLHWGFFLSISRRIIPYQIFSPKQMISWQIWKMIFALIGAGLSWLPSEAGLVGIVILLTPQGGWLLSRGRNCGGCTLPPFFTFLVSEDLRLIFSRPC